MILLILAGISINAVIGENGLISKARDAKAKTEQDAINTQIALNNLYDEMIGILGENSNGSSDTDDLGQPNIGDYVNYTYDTVADGYSLLSTQSGWSDQTVAQSDTVLQWRILNIDEENGTIDLVSAAPTDNTVAFNNSLGYNNGVLLLNDLCAYLYSNSSLGITARSINLIDMEKHLTTAGFAARNAYGSVQYGTTATATGNHMYKYPKLYENQLGSGIDLLEDETVSQPNINGTVDPYNESNPYYSAPTTETKTIASTSLTITQTDYNIAINETNYGEAASVLSSSNEYWVAARCANATSSMSRLGLREAGTQTSSAPLFYTFYNDGDGWPSHIRPIVSLPSSLLDGTKDAKGAWNLISAE